MRIVIFGANGPTGRLLTRLSLTAGYDTVAVTRQPGAFPLQDPRLRVAGADVLDAGAVTGEDEPTGGFLFNRVLQPYVTKRLGKTVYDDMRRMEDLVSRSDADWTILRPSGLYELPAVTDYSITSEHGPGRFTARIDLADAIVRQVTDDRFVRRAGHVITTRTTPACSR
jgi:uncharacterized protein YbjT (DUF2867 family)